MKPRPPRWALEAGLPEPLAAESFRAYWSRLGVAESTLNAVLRDLHGSTETVANERMSSYVARVAPDSYREAIFDLWVP